MLEQKMTSAKLRNWRIRRGMTQGKLAKLLDVTPRTVWNWEQRRIQHPRVVELALQRLAQHYRELED